MLCNTSQKYFCFPGNKTSTWSVIWFDKVNTKNPYSIAKLQEDEQVNKMVLFVNLLFAAVYKKMD